MRRLIILAVVAATMLALPATAFAGVTGPAFYVNGTLYRTVGTPTDFSNTGAPAHSYDTIYAISGQPNVATAAPGDAGYNGGRWQVEVLSFNDYEAAVDAVDSNGSGDLDTTAEVEAAMATDYFDGSSDGPSFECPVIPVPRGH
jgi:hypothetical protein